MLIRTTTDPISLRDVPDPENHPCVYDGDGDNGLEIYFENDDNRRIYLETKIDSQIVLQGNESDDYVAEG
jgi:hypothetical protein